MQAGFTMVEIVAVMVIVVILGAYAIPRMMGPGEFAVRAAADRLAAALHYAQTLAQRQGVATSVVIAASDPQITLKYTLSGTIVPLANETYSDYRVRLHPDVSITTGTITYGTDGLPTAGAGTYAVNEYGVKRFTVTVQPTGFVQLGS